MSDQSKWPEVTVMVCTYDRPKEIRRTLESLFNNLRYPADKIRWHIADDGTDVGEYEYMLDVPYIHDIIDWASRKYGRYITSATRTPRKGWGANVNTALKAITTDYVYFTEDDYLLQRPLDLRAYVALIDVVPTIGMVRFGLAGHDGLGCYLHEADVSGWLPDFCENAANPNPGKMNYWEIERSVSAGGVAFYKYSNRPHLKHRRFHDTYGFYPEDRPLALTEEGMNHQIAHIPIGPAIVCPADWVVWHYEHIGVSRQGTEADLHAA